VCNICMIDQQCLAIHRKHVSIWCTFLSILHLMVNTILGTSDWAVDIFIGDVGYFICISLSMNSLAGSPPYEILSHKHTMETY
jgi:hypothetical protein